MSNLKFETFILIAKCVTVLITYMWATVVSTDDSIDPLFIFLFIFSLLLRGARDTNQIPYFLTFWRSKIFRRYLCFAGIGIQNARLFLRVQNEKQRNQVLLLKKNNI